MFYCIVLFGLIVILLPSQLSIGLSLLPFKKISYFDHSQAYNLFLL